MSLSEAINLREPDLENYSPYLISLGYPMKYELSLVFDYSKILICWNKLYSILLYTMNNDLVLLSVKFAEKITIVVYLTIQW